MKIALGSDHRGFSLKELLKDRLARAGHVVADLGTNTPERTDYPDFAFKVARSVARRKSDRGILVCGTGIGMSMAANRVKGVRAALCCNTRLARMSRLHNNANVLCLGSDTLTRNQALRIVRVWLATGFEGGRHTRRLKKLDI
ncbi:MAG: ribose 5-phosphate isomerase B [candidate division WOR-3 bacterium]